MCPVQFGGLAGGPPVINNFNGKQYAVSNAVLFTLHLSAPLSEAQLQTAARGGIIEFGSNAQYVMCTPIPVPAPAAVFLGALGLSGLCLARRR